MLSQQSTATCSCGLLAKKFTHTTLRRTIFFLFLMSCRIANGQQNIDPTIFDYSKADSIALNFPKEKYKSYVELVAPLTKDLHTDHEKFRVLFRWITDNISYNYGNRSNDADKAIKKRKAVCIGYSTLLKEMCNSAGIECETIIGYSKTSIHDINKRLKETDHAWNAVKLYDKWYLLDVTWATSYYDERERKIIKSYDEYYYLTPPEQFVKNHFPKEVKWQLLDKPIHKSEFSKTHVFYSGYFDNQITDLQPRKGIIKMRLQDTLEIKFKSEIEIVRATFDLHNKKFLYSPQIEQQDNTYILKQKFENAGVYEFTLFLNRRSVGSYRLIVKE